MTNAGDVTKSMECADLALEHHYSVAQIAELWGLGETKVRELFRTEPGVLRSAPLSSLRLRKGQDAGRRVTLRIPESVLLRVHARLADTGG